MATKREYIFRLEKGNQTLKVEKKDLDSIYKARLYACKMISKMKDKNTVRYSVTIEYQKNPNRWIYYPEYRETIFYEDGEYLTNVLRYERPYNPIDLASGRYLK